ncbi:MAG: WD40 repeat domain-containing protein, partial [Deltaproteobacteria bacterium]
VGERALVSGARDGELLLWDLDSGSFTPFGQVGGVVRHMAVSADLTTVAVGVEDGITWLFDVEEREGRPLNRHADAVRHVGFSPDGAWLVTSSGDGTARVWPGEALSPSRLTGHERRIMDLAFTPDGKRLATASSDYTARLWNLRTGRSQVVAEHTDEVEAVGFSRGRMVTVSRDETLRMDGAVYPGKERIDGLAVSPDGRWAAGAMRGGTLSVWDLDSGELRELEGHKKRIHTVAFSAEGRLASGGKAADLRVWDLEAGTSDKLDDLGAEIGVVAWGPHGELAAATYEGLVWIDGARHKVGEGVVADLAWSATGALAVATEEGDAVVLADGEVRRFSGHTASVTRVDWAGDTLVSVSEDGTLRLWGTGDEAWSQSFSGDGAPLRALDVSPDGERVAAAGDDAVVHLWPTHPARNESEVRAQLRAVTTARVDDHGVLATP